jgi:LysR family transcriptional regulator, nitrogen assimilation regulatory protein
MVHVLMSDSVALDIKNLRYFVGIVDAGSVTRDSAMLHVAQPALTTRIRRLEDQLGVQLLVRGPSGVHPTAEGEVLYATAKRLLRDLENVADSVRTLGREPHGHVAMGCLTRPTGRGFPRARPYCG